MLLNKIISTSRSFKGFILFLSDTVFIVAAIIFSFSLRLGYVYIPPDLLDNKVSWLILFAPVVAIPIFIYFGLYREIIRYIGIKSIWSIVRAVSLYSIVWGLIVMLSGVTGFPRSVVLINFMASLIGIGGPRVLASYLLLKAENMSQQKEIRKNLTNKVLIYGAGPSGRQLAIGINHSLEYDLCGFIDDNKLLQGRDLMGFPVISIVGSKNFVKEKNITDILLAIPSITRAKRNDILKGLLPLRVRIKTLPGLFNPKKGDLVLNDIKDLDLDDLLMRDAVISDEEPLMAITKNKVVMITGAGGSIGSEICRQVVKRNPKILLLLEITEYALYEIQEELESMCLKLQSNEKLVALPRIITVLGSVQDEGRMTELMQTWNPDILYHAAAYKHVPMVEANLSEGIRNNVFGTLTLAKVAVEQGLDTFVLISTDKAVNPTSGMGASKRVAELILQAISAEKSIVFESINGNPVSVKQSTNFTKVRFGNVLGSSGSVVPLFRKQISRGGPITLTHKDITRFFMTISEASQLVMHSAAMKDKNINASEVYVLDMGKPIKIIQLARRMVELSGLRVKEKSFPQGEIEIKITGLRKGEKLYEEILIGNNPMKTSNPKILKAREEFIPWSVLQEKLQTLRLAADNNDPKLIVHILKELVIGYKPDDKIDDLVYIEQNK